MSRRARARAGAMLAKRFNVELPPDDDHDDDGDSDTDDAGDFMIFDGADRDAGEVRETVR